MGNANRGALLAFAGLAAAILAGCASEPPPPPIVSAPAVSPDALVGKWGFAAYHRDSDRARTVKEALAQCNKPYVINKGPNGGVMMNLADQRELSELVLKPGPDGKTYPRPAGRRGHRRRSPSARRGPQFVHDNLG